MPITLTPVKGSAQIARVYNGGEVVGKPPIDVVFLIEWEGPRVAWIRGAKGKFTRQTLRELLALLVSLGIHTIKAERGDGHVLPASFVDEAGVSHVDIPALAHRFATPGASSWADIGPSNPEETP